RPSSADTAPRRSPCWPAPSLRSRSWEPVRFSGRGQRWPPGGSWSAASLLDSTAVVDPGSGEACIERRLRALALADGTERPGIAAVRCHREERLRRCPLQHAEDLHLVADLLPTLEVEGDLALADHGRRLDHVRGEGDAIPAQFFHRMAIMHARHR